MGRLGENPRTVNDCLQLRPDPLSLSRNESDAAVAADRP
jgi:hypothetical protein